MKIGHLAKAIAHANTIASAKWSVGVKIRNAKNMPKTILHYSCSWQKTARKNTKCSREETNLKIGHLAKATAHPKVIAFAKWSVWVKN